MGSSRRHNMVKIVGPRNKQRELDISSPKKDTPKVYRFVGNIQHLYRLRQQMDAEVLDDIHPVEEALKMGIESGDGFVRSVQLCQDIQPRFLAIVNKTFAALDNIGAEAAEDISGVPLEYSVKLEIPGSKCYVRFLYTAIGNLALEFYDHDIPTVEILLLRSESAITAPKFTSGSLTDELAVCITKFNRRPNLSKNDIIWQKHYMAMLMALVAKEKWSEFKKVLPGKVTTPFM